MNYVLYGAAGCALCLKAKQLMEKAKLSYGYVDVGFAEGLADYHYEIDDCYGDGSKLPSLLMTASDTGNKGFHFEKKLYQGMSVIDYLKEVCKEGG